MEPRMNENNEPPLDELTRLHAKTVAMGIVLGALIGRIAEETPEIREDVQQDVARILATMPAESPSEELITAEVKRAAQILTSVSNV